MDGGPMSYYTIDYENQRILSLTNFNLPFKPAETFVGNTHNTLEISVIKSGKGVYHVDGKLFEFSEGDVFLFNNVEKHGIYRIDPPEPMQILVLEFEPSFIYYSDADFFNYNFLRIFFDRNDNFENRLCRNNLHTKEIGQLLFDMEKEFCQKEEGYELAVKVKLLSILLILIRYFGYTNTDESTYQLQKNNIHINRVLAEYIRKHYGEKLTLKSLAKLLNLNPSYVSGIFSKYNGISLWTFICQTRINIAKAYLKKTEKSISDISALCGFESVSNFNRIFKKFTQMSPSEFRKN